MDSKWVKACSKTLTCRGIQLKPGENVDIHAYNPTLCKPGGLHFCKVEDALKWTRVLEYDWVCDVEIPTDVKVTHGDDKSKASKIILSNHRPLRACPEIYLAAVQHNGWSLKHVPANFKTPELCLTAVQQAGLAIQYVPAEAMTVDICLAAVQQDGYAIQCIPETLRTVDVCITAIQENNQARKWVPHILDIYQATQPNELKRIVLL